MVETPKGVHLNVISNISEDEAGLSENEADKGKQTNG